MSTHPSPSPPTSTPHPPTHLHHWADLCAAAFSRKANPPTYQYFLHQFKCDPYADIQGICAITDTTTTALIASSRCVSRHIYLHGIRISINGVADVCCRQEYAGHGYAQQCIRHNELHYTQAHHIPLCALHTSQPALQSYYTGKLGYTSVPRQYVTTNLEAINDTLLSPTLKAYQHTVSAMMTELSASDLFTDRYVNEMNDMYNMFMQHNFNGAVVRTVQYWQTYVHNKITSKPTIRIDAFKIMANKLGAYMITELRIANDTTTLHVLEYAQQGEMNITAMMSQVLCITFIQRALRSVTGDSSDIHVSIALPLVRLLCPDLHITKGSITADNGMMYKAMDNVDANTQIDSTQMPPTRMPPVITFQQFQQQCSNKPASVSQLIDLLLQDAANKHFVSRLDAY